VDIFDPDKRQAIMKKIRSKETGLEKLVFRYLRSQRVYFQKHYKKVPGTPDVALPRKKRAVFIDSDFWHGRTLDEMIRRRGESDYWVKRIEVNAARDAKQRAELRKAGWEILEVWGTDLSRKSTGQEQLEKIAKFLQT
jgi:DNA mismatch endonuclease (patch repair protein)